MRTPERFVRTIKESCLERLVLFGEESLPKAIHNFVAYCHTERNHQGLANRLISPQPGHLGKAWVVQRRQTAPPPACMGFPLILPGDNSARTNPQRESFAHRFMRNEN